MPRSSRGLESRPSARADGFTLIELLVVMIIISILLAIAIPMFLSSKDKAKATKGKQNVMTIVHAIEACASGNNGINYNGCLSAPQIIDEDDSVADFLVSWGGGGLASTPTDRAVVIPLKGSVGGSCTGVGASVGYEIAYLIHGDSGAAIYMEYARVNDTEGGCWTGGGMTAIFPAGVTKRCTGYFGWSAAYALVRKFCGGSGSSWPTW